MIKKLPDNTVVVVTAGRGSVDDMAAADLLQEPAIKVPLFICLPKGLPNTVPEIVSTMDIAPTLYDLADIHPPQHVQGSSLMSAPPRNWALSRLRNLNLPHQTAFRSENWKLILTHGASDVMRLFNLTTDPSEATNLAETPDNQDRLEDMLDLLIDARVALEDRLEPRIAKF